MAKHTFTIVGGTDVPAPKMAAPTRIVGGPPNGREELLERDILEHEAATTAYLIAANAEFVAEGKVSAPDLACVNERRMLIRR